MTTSKRNMLIIAAVLIVVVAAALLLGNWGDGTRATGGEPTAAAEGASAENEAALTGNVADDEMMKIFDEMVAEKGEIYTWSPEDKLAFHNAISAAGFVRVNVQGTPGDADMKEADAIAQATALVKAQFGVTDDDLTKYDISPLFTIGNPDRPEWEVHFAPKDEADLGQISGFIVIIDSRSGRVMDLSADLEANG